MSKAIRVEDDTHAALAALKGEDETFDELLSRLVEERRESVREGADLWEGTDARASGRGPVSGKGPTRPSGLGRPARR